MKKEEKIILNEIYGAISAMKSELSRLEELAGKLASEVEDEADEEPVYAAPVVEAPVVEAAAFEASVDDFDMADSFEMPEEAEPAAVAAEPVVIEPVVASEATASAEPALAVSAEPAAAAVEPEPSILAGIEPAVIAMAAEKPKARKAVVDAMLTDEAWRTDMPSSEVKDIRSAIALNDRILVINKLFMGDAEDFQKTIAALNAMTSLDEAVDFLKSRYPDWKWNSDIVYRFMMSVRRKIR